MDMCLRYSGCKERDVLTAWTDASFSPEGSRSRSGYIITLGEHVLGWGSQRQTVTAWSATEAEIDGMCTGTQELLKYQTTLEDMLGRKLNVRLRGDNSAAIVLTKREGFTLGHWRTRIFAGRGAWLRDQVKEHDIEVDHVPGSGLIADMLTKTLPFRRLAELREAAGIVDVGCAPSEAATAGRTPQEADP